MVLSKTPPCELCFCSKFVASNLSSRYVELTIVAHVARQAPHCDKHSKEPPPDNIGHDETSPVAPSPLVATLLAACGVHWTSSGRARGVHIALQCSSVVFSMSSRAAQLSAVH